MRPRATGKCSGSRGSGRVAMSAVRLSLRALFAAAVCCAIVAVPARAAAPLNQYVVSHVSGKVLVDGGFDRIEAGRRPGRWVVVATPRQADSLRGRGATVRPLTGVSRPGPTRSIRRSGRHARRAQLAAPIRGYDVFRPWSLRPAACPTTCSTPLQPLKSYYHGLAQQFPGLVKEKII